MVAIVYWLSTYALDRTVDQSVLEQLTLLAARPPDLLPFMISSRMGQEPHVVTQVGLFESDGRLVVGDIKVIPPGLPFDGVVRTMPVEGPPEWQSTTDRVAATRLSRGRILVVARDIGDILALRRTLMRALALAVAPAFLLSLGGGLLIGRRTRRRLLRLAQVAGRVMAGQLHQRLPAQVPGDELDQLADLMNRILSRIEDLVLTLKGVGEDIAHDLRTPLTSVRVRLDRARDREQSVENLQQVIEQSIHDLDQTLAIIAALLRIGELEQGRRVSEFSLFDLVETVSDIAESYRPIAEDKTIFLTVDVPDRAPIRGDRDLLLELLANLLDNAIKFTPPAGNITIAVTSTALGPIVTVRDTGPGIPVGEHELVFRRFYRSDKSRGTPGSGLGLNLVAAIAQLHGFSLHLTESAPGCVVALHCWPETKSSDLASPDSVHLRDAVSRSG